MPTAPTSPSAWRFAHCGALWWLIVALATSAPAVVLTAAPVSAQEASPAPSQPAPCPPENPSCGDPAFPPPPDASPPLQSAREDTGSSINRTYKVQAGDTLYSIANRQGISVAALERANPGVDSRRLRIGQMLNLPAR